MVNKIKFNFTNNLKNKFTRKKNKWLDLLPNEVIILVSQHLDFKDKLEFNRTCSRIYNVVSTTTLYEKLDLVEYDHRREKIFGLFRDGILPGPQVKELRILACVLADHIYFNLPNIFPNVTTVWTPDYGRGFFPRMQEFPTTWSERLEVYSMREGVHALSRQLLHVPFPRLTYLELGDLAEFKGGMVGPHGLEVLAFLRNTPALQELTLYSCDISIDLLEGIHELCLHIHSMTWNTGIYMIDQGDLNRVIVPSTSMVSLRMHDLIPFDENANLLDYISTKYPHLRTLHLNFPFLKAWDHRLSSMRYPKSQPVFTPPSFLLPIYFKDILQNGSYAYDRKLPSFLINMSRTVQDLNCNFKIVSPLPGSTPPLRKRDKVKAFFKRLSSCFS